MQQLILHKRLYQVGKIDEAEYSAKVYERLEKIKLFDKLRGEGCSLVTSSMALKIPLSTIYRWKKKYGMFGLAGLENESKRPNKVRQKNWKPLLVKKILKLRKQNPIYGKDKITVLLKRDYNIAISVSTVGRIIAYLVKRGQIQPASFFYTRKKVRSRLFNNHAQRWKKNMKAKEAGELLQIDHMSVYIASGFRIKHFQAICPVTKMVVEQAYSRATSSVAKQFLEFVQTKLPFEIKSIQVDGGSEFMKEFELVCKDLGIPLYVLPPKSPEYNGNVERANGAAKFEFYAFYTGLLNLSTLRKNLQQYVEKYNTYRPHQALQYQTPLQYYRSISEA